MTGLATRDWRVRKLDPMKRITITANVSAIKNIATCDSWEERRRMQGVIYRNFKTLKKSGDISERSQLYEIESPELEGTSLHSEGQCQMFTSV